MAWDHLAAAAEAGMESCGARRSGAHHMRRQIAVRCDDRVAEGNKGWKFGIREWSWRLGPGLSGQGNRKAMVGQGRGLSSAEIVSVISSKTKQISFRSFVFLFVSLERGRLGNRSKRGNDSLTGSVEADARGGAPYGCCWYIP